MDIPREEPTVWTIGLGSAGFDDIERRLAVADVRLIVDVRSGTTMTAPNLDRRSLERLAADTELGYRWMGSNLAAPPNDVGNGDAANHASSAAFVAGIDELVALAGTNRTAILCSEASPYRCHRALLIAPALRDRGTEVVHILSDGAMRVDQPRLPLEGTS